MKMNRIIVCLLAAFVLTACNEKNNFDATGTFEATEITVSSEASGKILSFNINEGADIKEGDVICIIDSVQLHLQRKQLVAQQNALLSSRPDIQKQVSSLREQISKQKTELKRVENMLKDGAATAKQLDDIESQIRILESQLEATLSTLDSNTATINSNVAALEAQIEALTDRIAKCKILSPANGTVLMKYSEKGELASMAKPLLKMADLNNIYLRTYFTSEQIADISLGDKVIVIADYGADKQYEYEGVVTWISSQSEFTPKTIQTNDSRANLVYAAKVAVKNDGRLKIGMFGKIVLK
ncbi:MAG: efflux RND transporter periplasmic adaptor subunit [Bacteroidales bacterium]|nr:efflux RND transporter periplasmic adaptor subunit [Bacteroidales bacterium]